MGIQLDEESEHLSQFSLRRPGTFLKKGSWTSKNFWLRVSKLACFQIGKQKT